MPHRIIHLFAGQSQIQRHGLQHGRVMAPVAPGDFLIRPLRATDVHNVHSLHSLVLPVRYPATFFTQLLVLPSRACLIAVRRSQPDNPIAFISAALHKACAHGLPSFSASKALDSPRPRIELLTLGVLPAFQNNGLARRLIHAVVDKLSGPLTAGVLVHANVATSNNKAIKFYESIGLRVASDVIPNLYPRTPRSYKNYIGSTPDPIRRLRYVFFSVVFDSADYGANLTPLVANLDFPRQHNGELINGARETISYRPWIMQLLVHGFPSRSAATSFEYAWQNPHQSRFFSDTAGRRLFAKPGKMLIDNVLVLQQLIRTHPFSTWPLHVKLFTEDATQCWNELAYTSPFVSAYQYQSQSHNPDGNNHSLGDEKIEGQMFSSQQSYGQLFPPGFTCSVELEGVDGCSGIKGSGRVGPVPITDVTQQPTYGLHQLLRSAGKLRDMEIFSPGLRSFTMSLEQFTLPYLDKYRALIATGQDLHCSVCSTPMHDFPFDHLGVTLCTHTGCTSIAHLACLAKYWLDAERNGIASSAQSSAPSTLFSSTTSSSPQALPESGLTLPSEFSSPLAMSSPSPSSPAALLSPSSPVSGLQSVALSPLQNSVTETSKSAEIKPKGKLITKSNFSVINPDTVSYIASAVSLNNPFNLGKGLLPRGGTCTSCGNYTLWGDIVRGCYRRQAGRAVPEVDADEAVEEEVKGIEEQKALEAAKRTAKTKTKKKTKTRAKAKTMAKRKKQAKAKGNSVDDAPASPASKVAVKSRTKGKAKRKVGSSAAPNSGSEAPTTGPDNAVSSSPRKRGRPKKQKEGLTV
ncbi:hypothetical protein NP233_g4044 [Leucocoprinus birnbaumii]|uniref:N-acetyltransferase domain-containing protein n=1 Tax=Leucocoprinus birnbaumii TaxID=56174 RepID=A0AAD5W229_9AGAR|nr:hypothetical protein NP233_g4044 [Leucocoprinus birnbaumii]